MKFSNEKIQSFTAENVCPNSTTDYYPLHKDEIFHFDQYSVAYW